MDLISILIASLSIRDSQIIKKGFSMLKLAMFAIVSERFYVLTYRDYKFVYDPISIKDYVLSGQIIISILYFIATVIILEYVISALIYGLNYYITDRKDFTKDIDKKEVGLKIKALVLERYLNKKLSSCILTKRLDKNSMIKTWAGYKIDIFDDINKYVFQIFIMLFLIFKSQFIVLFTIFIIIIFISYHIRHRIFKIHRLSLLIEELKNNK